MMSIGMLILFLKVIVIMLWIYLNIIGENDYGKISLVSFFWINSSPRGFRALNRGLTLLYY
jgi:hypothetical protein